MNTDLLNTLDAITVASNLKHEIESHKPIDSEIKQRVLQKLKLNWNYHSNAIEGNELTYGETVALIMHGVTAKGKPLKDHLDIKGHNEAVAIILQSGKDQKRVTHTDVRELHKVLLKESYYSDAKTSSGEIVKRKILIGEYKQVPNHVETQTGEIHYYTEPHLVQSEMTDLLDWLDLQMNLKDLHPLVISAIFHHRFVAIHPFDYGNGRLARLFMNLVLVRNGYLPAVINLTRREEYYGALAQADAGDYQPLVNYIANCEIESLEVQLSAIKGENISSLKDLDKKIALFKASLTPLQKGEVVRDENKVSAIVNKVVLPLVSKLVEKTLLFSDLFERSSLYFLISLTDGEKVECNSLSSFSEKLRKINPLNLRKVKLHVSLLNLSGSPKSSSVSAGYDFRFLDNFYQIKVLNSNKDNIESAINSLLSLEEQNLLTEKLVSKVMADIEQNLK